MKNVISNLKTKNVCAYNERTTKLLKNRRLHGVVVHYISIPPDIIWAIKTNCKAKINIYKCYMRVFPQFCSY